MARSFLPFIFVAFFALIASQSHAVDVFPDLVSGTYSFHGKVGGADPTSDPTVTPTLALGAMRVDPDSTETGVLLACVQVDQSDYFAQIPISVTVSDTSQNATVRLFAFPKADCTGLISTESVDAARIFLVAPSFPELLAINFFRAIRSLTS